MFSTHQVDNKPNNSSDLLEQLNRIETHFVIGMPRAGTNLIRMILNRNEYMNCTPEVKFPMVFYKDFAQQNPLSPSILEKFKQFYSKRINQSSEIVEKNNSYSKFYVEEFIGLAQQYLPNLSYANLCKLFLLHVRGQEKDPSKIKYIVNKNPIFLFSVDELLNIFPDAKFIVTIRDYRSFCLSLKQSKDASAFTRFLGNSSASVSRYWNIQVKYINHLQKKYPNKILVVKYEDLANDNETVVKEICHFLGIPFFDAMLTHEQIVITPTDNTNARVKKKQGDLAQSVNTSRLMAWKTQLSQADIEICETICGGLGEQYNYAPSQEISTFKKKFIQAQCLHITTTTQVLHFFLTQNYYRLPFKIRLALQKYLKFTQ